MQELFSKTKILLTPNFLTVKYIDIQDVHEIKPMFLMFKGWLLYEIFVFQLLGNMALWDGLIPEHVHKELMLEKLLSRFLMITVLNESDSKHSIQKCKKVPVLPISI